MTSYATNQKRLRLINKNYKIYWPISQIKQNQQVLPIPCISTKCHAQDLIWQFTLVDSSSKGEIDCYADSFLNKSQQVTINLHCELGLLLNSATKNHTNY